MINISCFGEVLWDVFPTHKKIGGAPLNVALRLKSFKMNVSMISSIGDDQDGKALLEYMTQNGVNTNGVQVNTQFKTGEVAVKLNEKGAASYTIKFPSAWDHILLNDNNIKQVKTSDALIYGSLAARHDVSRNTLYELLEHAKYKIFDVNLRAPHYSKEVLMHLMTKADFIKFNDDEIFEMVEALYTNQASLEQAILFMAKETNTKIICVTKGKHGAVLYYNETFYHNSGYKIQVVDTIGAGDSFLASIVNQLSKDIHPQEALNFACAVGALVASNEGANPMIKKEVIDNMMTSAL